MRIAAVVVAGLAGCFPTYQPGSFPVAAEQLGCLDVSVLATVRAEAVGPVVVVYLGNRCDHRIAIDLTRLAVVGGDDAGARTALAPYDPAHEITAAGLDARGVGEEWIEYQPPGGAAAAFAWLDVDVGRIAADEPGQVRWIRAQVPR